MRVMTWSVVACRTGKRLEHFAALSRIYETPTEIPKNEIAAIKTEFPISTVELTALKALTEAQLTASVRRGYASFGEP